MQFIIDTEIFHGDNEAERWIVKVLVSQGEEGEKLRRDNFTVYIDPDKIDVTPVPVKDVRSSFRWDDWIFENAKGDIEVVSAIAVLAVFGNEDAYGSVIQARYPESKDSFGRNYEKYSPDDPYWEGKKQEMAEERARSLGSDV